MIYDPAKKNIFSSTFKIFTLLYISSNLCFGILFYHFFVIERDSKKEHLEETEAFAVSQQHTIIHEVIGGVRSDMLFLVNNSSLLNFLQDPTNLNLMNLHDDYLLFSKAKDKYDQIRYINQEGTEVVRINHNSGNQYVVHQNKLQNKAHRYYFKEGIKLGKDELFISPLDLNVENKTIEIPFKPTIRVCAAVFDRLGVKRGIVVLNYLAQDLLDKIIANEQVSKGQTFFVNEDGYYLHHPDPAKEWGFMLGNANQTLGVDDSEVWKIIAANNSGQIYTVNGLYTFQTTNPLDSNHHDIKEVGNGDSHHLSHGINEDKYLWHVVSHVTKKKLHEYYLPVYVEFLVFYIVCLVLTAIAGVSLAHNIVKRRIVQKQLRQMALKDRLTGLANRSLFQDRLAMLVENAKRYNNPFAVIFFDLDGFKQVNDNFGHAIGDKLLIKVAKTLEQQSRKSDTVARLGGDEFVILYTNMDSIESVQNFVERVMDTFKKKVVLEEYAISVGISVGIASFPENGENAEDVLKNADQAMYEAKKTGKNRYCVAQ